jgi:hypothetical protein
MRQGFKCRLFLLNLMLGFITYAVLIITQIRRWLDLRFQLVVEFLPSLHLVIIL